MSRKKNKDFMEKIKCLKNCITIRTNQTLRESAKSVIENPLSIGKIRKLNRNEGSSKIIPQIS